MNPGRGPSWGVATIALLLGACGHSTPTPSPAPSPACTSSASAYGRAVTSFWLPNCSVAQNIYNDPTAALGAPDAAGSGPDHYSGFVSLGFGGYVTVDMGGCLEDRPGADIRVFQAVSSEPVTVYVSTAPEGPFKLIEGRVSCGEALDKVRKFCDFDLARAGVTRAQYIKVQDGELYPCPGGTVTEGADFDAVQALSVPVSESAGAPQ